MSACERWFINRGPEFNDFPIRCECGESFSGFVAWADHISGRAPAVPSPSDTIVTEERDETAASEGTP